MAHLHISSVPFQKPPVPQEVVGASLLPLNVMQMAAVKVGIQRSCYMFKTRPQMGNIKNNITKSPKPLWFIVLEFHGFQQNGKRGMRKCINILASFYVKTTVTTVFLFLLTALGKHFACDRDPSASDLRKKITKYDDIKKSLFVRLVHHGL